MMASLVSWTTSKAFLSRAAFSGASDIFRAHFPRVEVPIIDIFRKLGSKISSSTDRGVVGKTSDFRSRVVRRCFRKRFTGLAVGWGRRRCGKCTYGSDVSVPVLVASPLLWIASSEPRERRGSADVPVGQLAAIVKASRTPNRSQDLLEAIKIKNIKKK